MQINSRILFGTLITLSLTACGGGGSGGNGSGGSTPQNFLVSTSVSDEITISPTSRSVQSGATTTFSLSFAEGYELQSASGCGGSYSNGTYTTGTITSACTVSAVAQKIELAVTATIPEGGSISPQQANVSYGEELTFEIELEPFYQIEEVSGCPVREPQAIGENQFSLQTRPLTESCDLVVTATLPDENELFDVSVFVLGQGQVDPPAAQVSFGEFVTFTLMPDEQHEIYEVSGCRGQLDGLHYNTGVIGEDCQVVVRFVHEESIEIPDPVLESELRFYLSLNDDEPITAEKMADLVDVSIANRGVRDLTGLEYAVNLVRLNVSSNRNLRRLAPISGLPLTQLDISETGIDSLSEVRDLPLENLTLNFTSITTLEPFPELRQLSFNSSPITDLTPLQASEQLNTLIFRDTPILDIRPLLQLPLWGAYILGDGCLDSRHRVTESAIMSIFYDGNSISVPRLPYRTDCAEQRGPLTAAVSADLTEEALSVAWEVDSTADLNDLNCEIHFDLYNQTPRVPAYLIENCAARGSTELPANQGAYQVSVIFDDGFGERKLETLERVLAASAEDRVRLETVDWGQVVVKTSPKLVPNRAALFRVFMTGPAGSPVPSGEIELYLDGEVARLPLHSPTSLAEEKQHDSLEYAHYTEIPSEWMQTGLRVSVYMDDTLIHQQTPNFSAEIPLYITIVPMVVNDVVPTIQSEEVLRQKIQQHWPFSRIELRFREPYVVQNQDEVTEAADLLYQLLDLRIAEGENSGSHYHGFFRFEEVGGSAAGVAFVPGRVGVTYDRANDLDTFSHELGHNFSVRHIDCGNPVNIENEFPYNPSSIGSVGVSRDNTQLRLPHTLADVMSYCNPVHVSDWVYEKAQDYQLRSPSQPFVADAAIAASDAPLVTRISGVVHPFLGTQVRSIMEVAAPQNTLGTSPYTLLATDTSGKQFVGRLTIHEDSQTQGSGAGYFEVYLDVPAAQLSQLEIVRGEQTMLRLDLPQADVIYWDTEAARTLSRR
ncbi:MAG: hypothetical protein LAT77_00820 [Aliidiomarina sp.]|uniref:hypothetical protein n=1 Tax=Aliidiomarina sp. TaxID=1872439 RepID=UPI0025C0E046|nr:hypothetical protein [Aliidiomarina sp.]MCH8500434.1 hypothetical protein [Aliidiomarina sp.]